MGVRSVHEALGIYTHDVHRRWGSVFWRSWARVIRGRLPVIGRLNADILHHGGQPAYAHGREAVGRAATARAPLPSTSRRDLRSMLSAQHMLAHGASGLVLGPMLAPRTLVRVQPLAMVERDAEGYIKEDALGDWTELKKSTALGATVTEWRDLPEAAQSIVTAVKEKPDSVEFDDVISGIDAGYDATEVEFEVNGLKSPPGRSVSK